MELISGIAAAASAINGAKSLAKSLHGAARPWPSKAPKETSFADLLLKQLQQPGAQKAADAAPRAKQFLDTRDRNRDGVLDLAESGFNRDMFQRLDADGNDRVSQAELVRPFAGGSATP